jgi:hypothetical protein
VPTSDQTNAEAACFLDTSSKLAYTTPTWYTTLPPAAQSYFASVNTNFAACTSVPAIAQPPNRSGSSLSPGAKAGAVVGSIASAAALVALVLWLLTKFGIIGSSTAAGTSAAQIPQSSWNGVVNPGWNGVVGGGSAPPPPPAPTGHAPIIIGAVGRDRRESSQSLKPDQHRVQGQGQGQGHSAYPVHEPHPMNPGFQGQQPYHGHNYSASLPSMQMPSYQSNVSVSPPLNHKSQMQGQYFGGDGRGRVSPVEAGGGGGNAHEVRGDQYAYQGELSGNPRYELQVGTPHQ